MFRSSVALLAMSLLPCIPAHAVGPGEGSATPAAVLLFRQAQAFEHAEGVRKDLGKAVELYCAAARMGNAEAAFNLGWMFANARGVPRDDGIAVALFRRAADLGHRTASQVLLQVQSETVRLPACMLPGALGDASALPPPNRPRSISIDVALSTGTAVNAAQSEVLVAVTNWASAWSRRDADAYLAFYADDFAVPADRTLQQWKEDRRARILEKSWIALKIENVTINVRRDRAEVRFRQDYRSDMLNELRLKVLELAKVGESWRITMERVEK